MDRLKIDVIAVLVVAGMALGLASFKAFAAPSLNEIDRKQKVLERKWELIEEQNKDKAAVSVGKEGFQLKSGDGKFALKLGGLVHADSRFFFDLPQNLGNNSFLLRRVRPIVEATLFDRFSVRIVPDFGGGTAVLQDAYADIRFIPEIKLRGGKFKEPVGLERLQSANSNLFVERGLPTNLVPNRDVGVQLFGDIGGGLVSYAVGAFNGVFDGGSSDGDNNDGKDIAGRVFVQPFLKTGIEPLKGLGVGAAATFGKQKGSASSPNLPGFKTAGQSTFFRYLNVPASGTTGASIVVAAGKVYRITPQLYYSWGPFGFLGEYVRSSQEVDSGGTVDTLTHRAWQTAASFVLTGEKASYKGVKPKNPINPKEGKWGAVEIAARYNELRVDSAAFPVFADPTASANLARGFGGGVNWYLNDNVKFVLDFEHTLFHGGAKTGNRQSENALQTRLQLYF
ncbi:MAG TPA: porin [bacterium]|nr:porin [bacterium]